VGTTLGAAALRRDGGVVAATDSAFVFLDRSGRPDGDPVPVDMPIGVRFNDGACDPTGRFLAGTTASAEQRRDGVLWSLGAHGEVSVALEGISESNGLDWSPDGTVFYYVDSGDTTIRRYRYAADCGEIGERLADLDDVAGTGWGVPDGLVVDGEGAIWVALWDGGAVRRYAPHGDLLDHIDMPVQRPTCPAFAGPGLDLLVVTSGWEGLPAGERAAQPWAGHVLAAPVGVSGRLPHRYGEGARS
jgi:sugar lactone lactonase YvrE